MAEFKVGTIVRVRGVRGPDMVIEELPTLAVDSGGVATCLWFAEGKAQTRNFRIKLLDIVEKVDPKAV
ncbi:MULTISPECIES: hypothetical protein [unclassified Mesorhizobium]|uniref:hypothetical protein n=1 Tax=unclassified Mesorhizobium TaxID=325217 RepID=UPI0011297D3C|nr:MULTISPECIES: hypothetical protein [unclassified Mesorhizobium]TPJ51641.1 hypothetical protein FJ426_20630 [Mesorhizobium sp. B2-6-4]TPN42319.1 hypothetical protein FJ979_01910 [Mesorhizobium sp. B1-1-6]